MKNKKHSLQLVLSLTTVFDQQTISPFVQQFMSVLVAPLFRGLRFHTQLSILRRIQTPESSEKFSEFFSDALTTELLEL